MKIDRYYGSTKYMLAAPLVIYLGGLAGQEKAWQTAGYQSGKAVLTSGLVTVIIKEMVGRSRPYTNEGAFSFKPLAMKEANRSFFSGHTSTTFAFSTALAYQSKSVPWRVFWWSASSLVGAARIYNDKHWLSDVVAGALVGFGFGYWATHE